MSEACLYRTVVYVDGFEGSVNGLIVLCTPGGVDLPPESGRVNLLSFPESMRDSIEKGKCFFARVNLGAEMPSRVRIEDIEDGWAKTDGPLHFDDTPRRQMSDETYTERQVLIIDVPEDWVCGPNTSTELLRSISGSLERGAYPDLILAVRPNGSAYVLKNRHGHGGELPPSGFDAIAQEINEWARGKGFYERESIPYGTGDLRGTVVNPSFPSEKVALIMSEGAEVLEALRDEDREEEAAECADIIIRVLDYAHWRGFSMDAEVAKKMEKNRGRPHKHGRKF